MRFIYLFFLVVLALPVTALARLGESQAELVARFGDPVSEAKEVAVVQDEIVPFGVRFSFLDGKWTVTCSLVDGRCARIIYSYSGEWTEERFSEFLSRNRQGSEWTDVTKPAVKKIMRAWDRADTGTASWFGNAMTLSDPSFLRAKDNAEAKARAEASRKNRD